MQDRHSFLRTSCHKSHRHGVWIHDGGSCSARKRHCFELKIFTSSLRRCVSRRGAQCSCTRVQDTCRRDDGDRREHGGRGLACPTLSLPVLRERREDTYSLAAPRAPHLDGDALDRRVNDPIKSRFRRRAPLMPSRSADPARLGARVIAVDLRRLLLHLVELIRRLTEPTPFYRSAARIRVIAGAVDPEAAGDGCGERAFWRSTGRPTSASSFDSASMRVAQRSGSQWTSSPFPTAMRSKNQ